MNLKLARQVVNLGEEAVLSRGAQRGQYDSLIESVLGGRQHARPGSRAQNVNRAMEHEPTRNIISQIHSARESSTDFGTFMQNFQGKAEEALPGLNLNQHVYNNSRRNVAARRKGTRAAAKEYSLAQQTVFEQADKDVSLLARGNDGVALSQPMSVTQQPNTYAGRSNARNRVKDGPGPLVPKNAPSEGVTAGPHQLEVHPMNDFLEMGGRVEKNARAAMDARRNSNVKISNEQMRQQVLDSPIESARVTEEGRSGFLGFGKKDPVTEQRTVRDVMEESSKSNTVINRVSSSNAGAGGVTPGDMGYAGFSGAFERHASGAVIGAGMGMMSEGEVSMGGAARGAMFGIAGGKAARMFTGSMRGGAVNSMARGVGDTLSAAENGTMRKTAGDYISGAMSGFDGAKSQEAMRMATFAGAGLAGFSMGRDRNHSRGMNGSRGSRF